MNARRLAEELGGEVVHLKNVTKLAYRKEEKNWRPLLYSPQAIDHPYLKQRKVTNGQIRKYDVKKLASGIGFPLKSRQNQILGIQERLHASGNNNSRYILHGSKPGTWPYRTSFLYEHRPLLVEGIFGVLRLERAGIRSYATLSSQITSRTILLFNGRQPTVWFDDDYAGYVGAAKLVLSTNARVIIAERSADDAPNARSAKSIVETARRTQDLEELAERSGKAKNFWKHIKLWRQKYSFSRLVH
jgi:hypothetical protein